MPKARAQAADLSLLDQGVTSCCYANSDKHWIVDPQGLPWEHFQTLGSIPVFGEGKAEPPATDAWADPAAGACCAPAKASGKPIGVPVKAAGSSCC